MIYRTALLQLLDWLVPPAPPAPRRQAKRQAAELAEAERQAEALAALAETEARLTAEAAEYVALIDHLCAPVADGGHGLVRESVQIVAYDTPQARSLHRIQEWRGGCGAVQIGQPETALRAMAPQISAVMDSAEPADTEPQQCDAETATWRSAPELLDMRFGPVDHACRGCWQHRGRNRGGHNVYRCDSGRHVLIDAHTVASHICNPVACEQPTEWALQP